MITTITENIKAFSDRLEALRAKDKAGKIDGAEFIELLILEQEEQSLSESLRGMAPP